MQFEKDNLKVELTNGGVMVGLYSPDKRTVLQLKARLPEQKSENAKETLTKVSSVLDTVKDIFGQIIDSLEEEKPK